MSIIKILVDIIRKTLSTKNYWQIQIYQYKYYYWQI